MSPEMFYFNAPGVMVCALQHQYPRWVTAYSGAM